MNDSANLFLEKIETLELQIETLESKVISLEEKNSEYIKEISNVEVKTFPIIFYDKKFIGGYSETIKYVDKLILAFDIPF